MFTVSPEGTIYIPCPSWRIKEPFDFKSVPFEDTVSITLEPYLDEAVHRVWEIEEEILTTAVVDLLRSRGYTVIEP